MLLNRSRAETILAREQLDGLIACQPINQYYLSDYWGIFNSAGGYDGAYFSVLAAGDAPAGLIVPALELRKIETSKQQGRGPWIENIYSYCSPLDEAEKYLPDGTPQGSNYIGWQPEGEPPLLALEKNWMSIVNTLGSQMSPNAFWAVTRALKNAEIEKGRVAVDDYRTAMWLESCGLTALECVYAPQLFNEIRQVKTPAELAIMQQAAIINENSLLMAAQGLYEGASWSEIENIYMQRMAEYGGRGVYLLCGLGELPAGSVRKNEPIMMDALGKFNHYHGDFGRCVVVGEPSDKQIKRHQAICKGWEVAQEYLKPGISYSELSATVGRAVRQSGIANFRDPVVHGLGLEHTDDPKPQGVMPQTIPDQILQENMVVNIDFPHTEIGWGSVHMEDTVAITKDGFKRLSQADFSLRVI